MKDYLEHFVYSYNSSILGEYTLGFFVYESYLNADKEGYAIKIINSLNDEECHLECYETYDEALEDVSRVNSLVKRFEEDFTNHLF